MVAARRLRRRRFSSAICASELLRLFVVGVLGDEFALDGEGEDGFAEVGGGDGVGRVEKKR